MLVNRVSWSTGTGSTTSAKFFKLVRFGAGVFRNQSEMVLPRQGMWERMRRKAELCIPISSITLYRSDHMVSDDLIKSRAYVSNFHPVFGNGCLKKGKPPVAHFTLSNLELFLIQKCTGHAQLPSYQIPATPQLSGGLKQKKTSHPIFSDIEVFSVDGGASSTVIWCLFYVRVFCTGVSLLFTLLESGLVPSVINLGGNVNVYFSFSIRKKFFIFDSGGLSTPHRVKVNEKAEQRVIYPPKTIQTLGVGSCASVESEQFLGWSRQERRQWHIDVNQTCSNIRE